MKLLVDQNLPPVLADWLRARGHDAIHAKDIGLADKNDALIAEAAIDGGYAIISKDADFAHDGPPQAVWVRLGNTTNTRLLSAFAEHWAEIETALKRGEYLIEIG